MESRRRKKRRLGEIKQWRKDREGEIMEGGGFGSKERRKERKRRS